MRKQPDDTPPTVAGPMIVTPRSDAARMRRRVCCSGTPSAMMAIVRTAGCDVNTSSVDGYTERNDAKLTNTVTSGLRRSACAAGTIRE